jgi:glycosyltransferase involved in cell wall biosynthesis
MTSEEKILPAANQGAMEINIPGSGSSGEEPCRSGGTSVLVLIPARNESRTIGPIVEAVRARLPVLVIDDGSVDDTAGRARQAGAEVVSHPVNLRKGAALKTGFKWALKAGYGTVITMDADGQHDPADLDKLLEANRSQRAGLIIGERDFSRMPWPNRFTTPLGAGMLSWALGTPVTDNQSGYRLLTKDLLERMTLRSDGYEMEVEMIWEAIRLRIPIVWVPIRTIYFPDRQSGFRPFRDTLLFLRMVWRIRRDRVLLERHGEASPQTGKP